MIDTHVHLFDPTRPAGIPWPKAEDAILYKPALPERLRQLSSPYGVVGAIAIEASPLRSDNDWLLSIVERNPFMVGMIGNLEPGSAPFTQDLDKLRANTLFKGIRYGNLWDRDLAAAVHRASFVQGLRRLADASMIFESANPDLKLLQALNTISDQVPSLTIVVDHLPHMEVASGAASQSAFESLLKSLGKNQRVYAKLSESVLPEGSSPEMTQRMHDRLELLWSIFGPDRLMFGSDWPNGDHVAPYETTINTARTFVATKGQIAERKVFWDTSKKVYTWQSRHPSQNPLL